MIVVSELCRQAYQTAKDKGFEVEVSGPKDISQKLLLSVSEICEAQDEIRKGEDPRSIYFQGDKPEGFPVEIADAFIRLAQLCYSLDIDLEHALSLKLAYNKTRPYLHGKKF